MSKNRAKAAQPEFNKSLLYVVLAAAAAGLGLAAYSVQISLKIAGDGLVNASGCSLGDLVNCDYAHASSYSELLGIPVAGWGLVFFLFAGLAALWAVSGSNKRAAGGMLAFAWVLSVFSAVFSLVKAYQLYDLGVVCLVCVGMYMAIFALAVLIPLALKSGFPNLANGLVAAARGGEHGLTFEPAVTRWATVALVLFALGWVVVKREVDAAHPVADVDIEQAVTAHFRSQPVTVAVDSAAAVWGNPNAKILVVEFADFQCPACRESAFHLRPALFEFRDDIQLRFMNFPLDSNVNEMMEAQNHANAGPAAKAGVCAAEFGDFWGYHDELFEDQGLLGPDLYRRLAEKRGWNVAEFEACTQRPEVLARLKSDVAAGIAANLRYTPSIYINGRYVTQWQNTEVIRAILREEIKRAG